jgi:hypothetical protein
VREQLTATLIFIGLTKDYRSKGEGTYGRPSEAALMRMSAIAISSTPQEIK